MKRGAIEIQFNWIFVLVAGALILALAVGFVIRWKNVSELKDAEQTISAIQTYVISSSTISGKEINISLNDFIIHNYATEINIKGINQKLFMFFSPTEIKGSEMFIWSKAWSAPFLISNFAYSTTPQTRYFFVFDPLDNQSLNLMEMVNDSFPDNAYIEYINVIDFSSVDSRKEFPTVIAFFEVPMISDFTIKGNVKGVEISFDDNNFSGELKFFDYESRDTPQSSGFLGDEMIIGAVVSGDLEIYEEVMKDAFERMNVMCRILISRVEQIKANSLIASNSDSVLRYDLALSALRGIQSDVNDISVTPSLFLSRKTHLIQVIEDLKFQNKIMNIEKGPTIY
jgi:hypothetical protein